MLLCNGVWGQSPQRDPRAEPLVGGHPEAEALLAFERSIEALNLLSFLKFEKCQKSDICVFFAKNHGWLRNWGPVPPWFWPKAATG